MNLQYLDSLPEVSNEFGADLQEGEKVLFTAKNFIFGNDKDRMLGSEPNTWFTLTNRRILAYNGAGLWTIDIAEEVESCKKVESGKWIFKSTYISLVLKQEMDYDNGRQKLKGFHFYFKKEEMVQFESIMNHLFED